MVEFIFMHHAESESSWGESSHEVDPRSLRIYNRLLKTLCSTGEIASMALCVLMVGMTVKLLFFTNFENVRFFDGTDQVCLYNGETGEIRDESI